jgi:hypothetical protein
VLGAEKAMNIVTVAFCGEGQAAVNLYIWQQVAEAEEAEANGKT